MGKVDSKLEAMCGIPGRGFQPILELVDSAWEIEDQKDLINLYTNTVLDGTSVYDSVILSVRYRNHSPVVRFQNQAHILNPHGTGHVIKPFGAPKAPQIFIFLSPSKAA